MLLSLGGLANTKERQSWVAWQTMVIVTALYPAVLTVHTCTYSHWCVRLGELLKHFPVPHVSFIIMLLVVAQVCTELHQRVTNLLLLLLLLACHEPLHKKQKLYNVIATKLFFIAL